MSDILIVDDKPKHVGHYSYRSATSGSTFVARRAGIRHAVNQPRIPDKK